VVMTNAAFGMLKVSRCFGGKRRLHLQGRSVKHRNAGYVPLDG
jgi:hypothetical protein